MERAAAGASGGSVPGALELHVRADALALTGQAGSEALGAVLSRALACLSLSYRTLLAARLRAALHESIADCAGDPAALECWRGILAGEAAQPRAVAARSCGAGVLADGAAREAPLGGDGGVWGKVLCFAASLDALARGAHFVSRGFRHLLASPVCWQGKDITLEEHHLRGLTIRGDSGWGQAFALLPALQLARTVRVAGFSDGALRLRALPPLRRACWELCPGASLLACSFCERTCGARVELPSPRRLTAARRPAREQPKGGGLLIGNGPVPADDSGCRGFTVRLERLPQGERLDVGVTSVAPHEHFTERPGRAHRHVSFAEDLLSSWVVESSGLLVGSHAGLRIRDGRWDARSLQEGDEVGLLVTEAGELVLGVNGEVRASWRAQIPRGSPVYPVVDLFEGSPTVLLRPGVPILREALQLPVAPAPT